MLVGLATDSYASLPAGCAALAVFGFANGSTDVLMNVEGSRAENAVGRTRLPLMHGFFSIGNIAGAVLGALAPTPESQVALHLSVIAVLILVVGSRAVARLPRSDNDESVAQSADEPLRWRW